MLLGLPPSEDIGPTPADGEANRPRLMTDVALRLSRNPYVWLLLIFLLALAVRGVWSLYADANPRAAWRWDATIYDSEAYALAKGDGYVDFQGMPTAHWPPGYPLALAPLYRLSDNSLLVASLFNAVLGSLTVGLLYLLGARIFGRLAGLAAALALALFPNQVFFTSQTMTETLFTTLFVLSLVLVVYLLLASKPPRLWHLALVGVLLGGASLVRGEAVLLFAVIAPALYLRWRSWRATLGYSAVLVLGMALVIAPWTVRNIVRMKAPILISTSATEALWVGHHEGADGKIADFSVNDVYADVSNPEKEVKINNEALREALSFIREHPLQDLQLIPKKLSALYSGDSSGIRWLQLNAPTIDAGDANKLQTLGNDYYRVVLALAILGVPAWFSLRDPSKALLLGVVIYWTLLFSVVFFGDQRFHFPLEPILALWAAVSILAIGKLLLRIRPGRKRAISY